MVHKDSPGTMRRSTSCLSWLAIFLVALAPAAMGLGLPAVAVELPVAAHSAPAAHEAGHGHEASAVHLQDEASGARSHHHDSSASCCAIGCVVVALLDEQRVQQPAPQRLLAQPAPQVAAGRATSPPRRPPRLRG